VVLGYEHGIGALWAPGQTLVVNRLLRLASQECQAAAGLVGQVDARRLVCLNPGLVVLVVLLTVASGSGGKVLISC
jgi:hypothetical protein